MPNSELIEIFNESFSYLSWLQVRAARLGDHKNAKTLREIEENLDKYSMILSRDPQILSEAHVRSFMSLLLELSAEGALLTEEKVMALKDRAKAMCRGLSGPFEKRLLISRDSIKGRIKEMADALRKELDPEKTVVLGVLRGAIFFMVDLLRELDLPLRYDFIEAKSYGDRMESSRQVSFPRLMDLDITNKIVLVVEDIVDSGHTMKELLKILQQKDPQRVITCVLIDKLERREVPLELDYTGFRVEKGFLVGYGLDYADNYRCLWNIYSLEPSITEGDTDDSPVR